MITNPKDSAAARSRLDPEPIPRRDFLGLAAVWAAATAALFALGGILRLPKAAVLPSPSKKFRVVLPETLPEGEAFLPPRRSVALFRDAEGVFAVSTICTHLGCIVKAEADGFHCPCHGSAFAKDGAVLRGPAPKALPWLAVTREGSGIYVVDEGKTVPLGTRAEA
ncbi:MAG: ubiquinol-cytochrome c reductase iron-sulfur subunit [Candidatus Eisenbacteria bacterium]|nr:ubiquinol-cytochrome c reductase iron-sulfur subunit [Candidatus Eisenbacteria bacterium]